MSEKLEPANPQTLTAQYSALLPTKTAFKRDSSPAENDVISHRLNQPLSLRETFTINYSAQAYEGGNLTDITRSMALTWQEVLHALAKIPATFSSYGLQSCLNRLIASKAEKDIKQEMPNVHAVARCKIVQNDLNKLQRILVAANWIQLTTYGVRVSQEMWKLTFYAKNIFAESSPKGPN